MPPLLKKPSAWIPIALSLIVIAAWGIGFATAGVPARQPDEGTGAHLFQIWLLLEALLIALFAVKWLPRFPKQTIVILALQIIFILAGMAPVFYFNS